jgi:O-methyltransferase
MTILKTILRPVYSPLKRSKWFGEFTWKQAHSIRLREWMDSHPCKNCGSDGSESRVDLWNYVKATCNLSGPINYLEFGVYQGHSIKWWVKENTDPSSRFVGFDSFQGLPEDWTSENRAGHFSTQGRIPEVADPRCSFKVGYFNETLPDFVRSFPFDKKLVVHLDADIYSSTLCVLSLLQPYLKPEDVLIFDEFCDSCNEFRAFTDFISAFGLKYVPIANAANYWHFALQIV